MSQLFKNFIGTTNVTGSAVTFKECPAGKTLVFSGITSFNGNASTVTQQVHLLDASEDSSNTIEFGSSYTIGSGNAVFFSTKFILEEGDKIGFESNQDTQRISGSFVLLDSSSRTRYRLLSKKITTEDSFVDILEAPAGHTIIMKQLILKNKSGSNATGTDNELRLVEAATNTQVPFARGTLNDDAIANFNNTMVLEPGDKIQSRITEQPYTVSIFYQELPTPTIRGQ
tara:strand:+ start:63 stop:746 length:684 start_codon:yes stop_codon:yes gene_type:complete